MRGDTALKNEEVRYEKNKKEQKDTISTELNKMNAEYEQKTIEKQKNHEQKLAKTDALYEKGFQDLKNEHEERRKYTEYQNEQALTNLNKNFTREIEAEKRRNYKAMTKYGQRNEDPFYNNSRLDTKFTEEDSYYKVVTKIPEHEIKNTDVLIQKDRIIIAAKRQWHDEVKQDDGVKTATNRHETIREEFPIKKAIEEKKVVQTYSNGELTVFVPKVT